MMCEQASILCVSMIQFNHGVEKLLVDCNFYQWLWLPVLTQCARERFQSLLLSHKNRKRDKGGTNTICRNDVHLSINVQLFCLVRHVKRTGRGSINVMWIRLRVSFFSCFLASGGTVMEHWWNANMFIIGVLSFFRILFNDPRQI